MIWETPIVEDIACGMEVTAYAPAGEGDDLNTTPEVTVEAAEA